MIISYWSRWILIKKRIFTYKVPPSEGIFLLKDPSFLVLVCNCQDAHRSTCFQMDSFFLVQYTKWLKGGVRQKLLLNKSSHTLHGTVERCLRYASTTFSFNSPEIKDSDWGWKLSFHSEVWKYLHRRTLKEQYRSFWSCKQDILWQHQHPFHCFLFSSMFECNHSKTHVNIQLFCDQFLQSHIELIMKLQTQESVFLDVSLIANGTRDFLFRFFNVFLLESGMQIATVVTILAKTLNIKGTHFLNSLLGEGWWRWSIGRWLVQERWNRRSRRSGSCGDMSRSRRGSWMGKATGNTKSTTTFKKVSTKWTSIVVHTISISISITIEGSQSVQHCIVVVACFVKTQIPAEVAKLPFEIPRIRKNPWKI